MFVKQNNLLTHKKNRIVDQIHNTILYQSIRQFGNDVPFK